jgi:general secretion pathway protein G
MRLRQRTQSGMTLVELIVAITIVMILASMAMPVARFAVRRQKERELRRDLYQMRDAIDKYKDATDRGLIQIKLGTDGWPPDLDTLVQGVDVNGKKVRFLRKIPIDPMTGNNEWGVRSNSDDPDSDSSNGENLFDVYSKSEQTAMNGTKYKEW